MVARGCSARIWFISAALFTSGIWLSTMTRR